jgi:hypothetical protein
MWHLVFRQLDSLPKLAWLAEVDALNASVTVDHGRAVECRDDWCVEGVWEGAFEEGNFHRVENFFGSGIRIEGDELVFCSSVALVDRIFHVTWHGRLLVSNSLVQLLARTGARLDASHDYAPETFASRQGIHRQPCPVRVLHPHFTTVQQDYHCNLIFAGGKLSRVVRSTPRRFDSFGSYHEALRSALRRLGENYRSAARRYPLAAFSTLSTGYDSTAASVLVRELGVSECFTTDSGHGSVRRRQESGLAMARTLDLKPNILGDPSNVMAVERYFLAGCTDGSEVFYHDVVAHLARRCQAAIVFTGYYGLVWNRGDGPPAFTDDIRRRDVSGLGVSEVRLHAGFFNVPIPQIYARNIGDIMAISQSDEMRPWCLFNDYDRPIPRRIVEAAGVPRSLFGMEKRAQLFYYNEPRNRELRQHFRKFLRSEAGFTPLRLWLTEWLHQADYRFRRIFRRRSWLSGRLTDMRGLMYVWAVNSLAADFQRAWADPLRLHPRIDHLVVRGAPAGRSQALDQGPESA